jgi:hypothetical protein
MLTGNLEKNPAAILDYYMNWTVWLAGDTLIDSTWSATGSVTLSEPAMVGSVTSVWVAGGIAGELVDLTNLVVTTGGRKEKATLRLILRE